MDLFPLTLFPDGGLASSVITTVWVGVFVLCFFNLRYGWVLSGLVVPGYLVPLVIVKPLAAVVIVIEAVMTYAIVWLFSEKLSRGRFPSLFGRDRFMGLILASIAVRLSMDGYVLPEIANWLEQNFDRTFDWQDNLQSFGLVIISLLANQFWKPGLARGLVAAVVTIGLTYVIVRFGLMELTNFRMSGVSYLYEGLASSILASPKAYIILTLTAMIASQVNVRYGWDFSGILIPALIALQWYQPTKVLTSFAEAIVIYLVARMILRLPIMANVTMEGGRKLLLFFNISFAWKLLLGWIIVWQGFDVKTTDFYGFGYLLSTLIAIKAHDKNIFPRLARSTLQVSLAGAVLGNLVGFTLSAGVTRTMLATASASDGGDAEATPRQNALVVQAVGDAHVRRVRGTATPLSDRSAETLSGLVEVLEAGIPATSPVLDLSADGWSVQAIENGKLAVVRSDGIGHEVLLFDPDGRADLAIALEDSAAATGLSTAALQVQRTQGARWLIFGAASSAAALAERSVLDVFAQATSVPILRIAAGGDDTGARAAFANRSARAVDFTALRRVLPEVDITLQVRSAEASGNEAVLELDPVQIRNLASQFAPRLRGSGRASCRMPRPPQVAPAWDSLQELAFYRYEIAEPLLAQVTRGADPLRARAAARLGEFAIERCSLAGADHWALFSPLRDEGYVFIKDAQPLVKSILAYREGRSTRVARMGAALHRGWNADALLVASVADKQLRTSRLATDVMWQAIAREQDPSLNPMTIQFREQTRLLPNYRGASQVVIARDWIGTPDEEVRGFVSLLRRAGVRAELATQDKRWAGFEPQRSVSTRYFAQGDGYRRHVIGWVMPEVRER